jgi:uncharacterized protein (DUF1810 family)
MTHDIYQLRRFVEAQEPVFEQAREELRAGKKRSHWMWFIFPQMRGLGRSPMAEWFGIGSREEAAAYLAHPDLGPRLRECTRIVLEVQAQTASDIFGFPDDLKFRSSMTLFAAIEPQGIFRDALEKYFEGKPDGATLRKLN